MSDLRDRIAAVLYKRFTHALGYADAPWDSVDHEPWLEDADAVIAELGMRQETVGLIHRWVTDWQPDKASYCQRCGIPHSTPCKRLADA